MRRLQMLREQARILRDLAKLQTNEKQIHEQILELAEKCDQLADERERGLIITGVLPLAPDAA